MGREVCGQQPCHIVLSVVSSLFSRLFFISQAAVRWPRSRTHLSKSATSGCFCKLSTEQTRSSDSFRESVLKRPEQMLWVEVTRHDGMQERIFAAGIQNFTRIAEFSNLRFCHDRLGRGCIERDSNVHNRSRMAAANQSNTLNLERSMVQLRFPHGE